jgi:hypothetical protein
MIETENKIKLGDKKDDFIKYCYDTIKDLKSDTQTMFESKLTEWRRILEAKPLEDKREFPFPNACNLVVPIAGIHKDTLKARVMAAVFKTQPIWPVETTGTYKGKVDKPAKALQIALSYWSSDPWEFDLYPTYSRWLDDIISFGTGFLKTPYLVKKVWKRTTLGQEIEDTEFEGPKPEFVPFDCLLSDVTEPNLDNSKFISHILRVKKQWLKDKQDDDSFNSDAIEAVLQHSDRSGPTETTQSTLADASIEVQNSDRTREWDIHEIHGLYKFGKNKLKFIAWFHFETKQLLKIIYSEYDRCIFIATRLLERSGCLYGYGLCEILGNFQEEVSQIHCQRRDAQTVANSNFIRVDPNSKLTPNYQICPGAQVPAASGEIEPMNFGAPQTGGIDEEQLALDLAKQRTGIDAQGFQGSGAGSFNKKGVYNTFGTFSVMQEGNNRIDLNIADFRNSHVKVGRLITGLKAKYQSDSKYYAMFGEEDAKNISAALKMIDNKEAVISASQSNASINREVEKQSDVMLVQMMQRHYDYVIKLLTNANMQQLGPEVNSFARDAASKLTAFMTDVLRQFNKQDPSVYLPETLNNEQFQQLQQQSKQQQQGNKQGGSLQNPASQANGLPGMGAINGGIPGGNGGFAGSPGSIQ